MLRFLTFGHPMPPRQARSPAQAARAYATAVALVALAAAVDLAARPALAPRLWAMFLVAIVIASLLEGLGPGIVASLLSTIAAALWFTDPPGQSHLFDAADQVRNLFLFASGVMVVLPCAALRDGRIAAAWQARENAHLRDLAEEAAAQAEEEAARAEEETARAEEEAARAEDAAAELEQTLNSITDGFMRLDADWCVRYLNDQALVASERSADELLGRSLWTVSPELLGTRFEEAFRRAMAEQTVVRFEEYFAPRDRWYQVSAYPSPNGLSAFFQDVSELRRAQSAGRESELRLQLALDAGRFGLWDWDIAADRVTWTDRVYALHGIAPDEFGGRVADFADRVHPDDRPAVEHAISQALATCGEYAIEFRVPQPDGGTRWLATNGRAFGDASGRPVRMLGLTWDVTERREGQERLAQVQRIESVGRLAGGIAHEVNNQMSVVLGFADLVLRSTELSPALQDDIVQIRTAGQRAASITSQLLAFSRRQLLRPESLELGDVVRGFRRVLDRTVAEPCRLRYELAAEAGPVRADRGQLEQVLLNLVLNGCDAMPDGGEMTITTETVRFRAGEPAPHTGVPIRPGAYARLRVRDTGHGIDPALQGQIFEPFFTTKPVGQGSGLGLSTVYGIVKQSGGYIAVESEPGIGTSFSVYLPVAMPIAVAAVTPEDATSGRRSGRVLVVEDEEPVRLVVTRALAEEGYDVLAATTGHEALDLLAREPGVRLVVTDVAMPEMNGRELARRLAASRPELPVLFMSGYPDRDIVSRGLLDEGRPFLQKPFDTETVVRRVAELLAASPDPPAAIAG